MLYFLRTTAIFWFFTNNNGTLKCVIDLCPVPIKVTHTVTLNLMGSTSKEKDMNVGKGFFDGKGSKSNYNVFYFISFLMYSFILILFCISITVLPPHFLFPPCPSPFHLPIHSSQYITVLMGSQQSLAHCWGRTKLPHIKTEHDFPP